MLDGLVAEIKKSFTEPTRKIERQNVGRRFYKYKAYADIRASSWERGVKYNCVQTLNKNTCLLLKNRHCAFACW